MSDHFPENYRSRPRRKFHQQSLAKNVLNRTCAWAMPIGQSLMMYRNSSKFIFPSLSYTHRHQTLSITRAQWMYWVAHLVAFSNHIPASIQQNSGPSTSCVREIGWDYRSHRASSIVSTSPTCVLHRLSVGYRTAERITAYQQFDFKPTNSHSQYRAHHPDEVLSRDVACTQHTMFPQRSQNRPQQTPIFLSTTFKSKTRRRLAAWIYNVNGWAWSSARATHHCH